MEPLEAANSKLLEMDLLHARVYRPISGPIADLAIPLEQNVSRMVELYQEIEYLLPDWTVVYVDSLCKYALLPRPKPLLFVIKGEIE